MIGIPTALVLAMHLICVNVASAAPLVCIWLEWKEAAGDSLAGRIGRYLAKASLWLLLAGGVLGLALGVLIWSDDLLAAIKRMPSKIHFAVWEYLFSLVLLAVYSFWWGKSTSTGGGARSLRCLLAFLASTNLLYHFPTLFVILSHTAEGRVGVEGPIDAAAFRSLMVGGEVLARSVHFLLASFAVTGIAVTHFAMRLYREQGEESEEAKRVTIFGARLALTPTLAQLLVGMWLLMKLPRPAMKSLMGGDMIGTSLLLVSLLISLWLMHQLSSLSLGKTSKKAIMRASLTMVIVIVLMCGMLQRIKSDAAPPVDEPAAQTTFSPSAHRV